MGKKSNPAPPPPPPAPPPPPQQEPEDVLGPVTELMALMFSQQQASTAALIGGFSEQYATLLTNQQASFNDEVETDWEAERAAIRERLSFGGRGPAGDPAQGRSSTFLTSPLLDDQEPSTLSPVALGGPSENS